MAVCANSGPLIALARIDHLKLLPTLFEQVIVPPAVYREITRDTSLAGADELSRADWLRIEVPVDRERVGRLLLWLDPGESEAIVLAQQMDLTLVMDEQRGRTMAAALGLSITGTVGVLLAAKAKREIASITPLLDSLIANGIRISSRLYQSARLLAGEG